MPPLPPRNDDGEGGGKEVSENCLFLYLTFLCPKRDTIRCMNECQRYHRRTRSLGDWLVELDRDW